MYDEKTKKAQKVPILRLNTVIKDKDTQKKSQNHQSSSQNSSLNQVSSKQISQESPLKQDDEKVEIKEDKETKNDDE